MTTVTFAPTAGDGYLQNSGTAAQWSTIRSAASGTLASYTDTTYGALSQVVQTGFVVYIQRGVVNFDTSSIPDGATITAATLKLFCPTGGKSSSAGGSLCLVSASPASTTSLAVSDYSSFGSTDYMTRVDLSSLTENAYNNFALNAAGLAAINTSGVTSFGTRISIDVDDGGAPANNTSALAHFYPGERSGTSNDPELEVTYTVAGGAPSIRPRPRSLYTR